MKKRFMIFLLAAFSLNASAQDEAMVNCFINAYKSEKSGDHDEAIKFISGVKTDNYEKNLKLGELYYKKENYQESINYYKIAIVKKSHSVEAHHKLVNSAAKLKDWKLVSTTYNNLLAIDPDNKDALYNLSTMMYNTKQYAIAKHHLEHLIELYPMDYDALLLAGWNYFRMGLNDRAKKCFHKALCVRADSKSAREGLKAVDGK